MHWIPSVLFFLMSAIVFNMASGQTGARWEVAIAAALLFLVIGLIAGLMALGPKHQDPCLPG